MIHDGGVVLRRRGLLECTDLGFALLRADARAIARTYALPGLLTVAISLAAWWLTPWLGLVIAALLGPPAAASCTLLAGERLTGTPHPPGPAHPLLAARRFTAATWFARGLTYAAMFVPPVAVAIAGRTLFLPEVALLERPPSPFRRAERIAERAGSTAYPAVLLITVLAGFGVLGGEATGQLVAAGLLQLGTPFGELVSSEPTATPYAILGLIAVQPLVAMVRLAFYLEARTREEGLDVYFALWSAAVRE